MLLILRIVLILLIVRAVLMFVRGVMQGSQPGSAGGGGVAQAKRVQLMRDPVCGVYVPPSKAITERSGAGTAYFCSEKCRQEWIHR